MSHDHDHAHGAREADTKRLGIALALILTFMAFEVAMAVVASSLALLSDAAHMLTDAAALGLAIVAARLAARPARGAMTYGLGRAEILSAQLNGATLIILAAFIVFEAIAARTRLFQLAESLGGVESLIEVPARMTHAATADAPFAAPPNLIRLSVGIESAQDLMDDLENALVPAAARA